MAFLFPSKPTFGAELGTGLGQGLTALAEQKLQQIQQRNMANKLGSGLQQYGIPQEQAKGVSALLASTPPELHPIILKDILSRGSEEQYAKELGLSTAPTQPTEGAQISSTSAAPRLNKKEALEIAKFRQQQNQFAEKQKAEAFKQTKKERIELLNKGKSARLDLESLNRMQELNEKGDLTTAGFNELVKRSGLDIPALKGADAEEFNKLTKGFLRNAKNYFGSRVSNFDLQSFLETLPDLSQSPEGRKRIISSLKNIARLEIEGAKAAKAIIKENGGVPPLDLYEQVDDRISNKADKFAKKFKRDIARPVPAAQNKLLTAGGAILGEGINFLKKQAGPLLGAAGGYAVGGPKGAAIGYGLGGGLKDLLK